jgi:hypothetical protein
MLDWIMGQRDVWDRHVNPRRKKALQGVLDEVGKLVGEEISCT